MLIRALAPDTRCLDSSRKSETTTRTLLDPAIMKFLIEVLPEWPSEAKSQGHFDHQPMRDSRTVFAVEADGKTASVAILQGPLLEEIPAHSVVRITRTES